MAKNTGKKEGFAGGLGILAAAAYLCVKGLKRVDAHMREKAKKNP